jgi:predicted HTH transcriptional regulator
VITAEQIKKLISQGETTTIQFKIRTEDAYKMGVEMVAFSNAQGGILVIGINDKTGVISGLSFEEIQQANALLVNAASENVKPAIIINTETINIDGQNIIVATIPKGKDKPYKDNKGIIWMKNGSDKRKVFSNAELRVMMQSCGNLSADNDSVVDTSIKDVDTQTLKLFLLNRYEKELKDKGISGTSLQTLEVEDMVLAIDKNFTLEQLLTNISILDNKGQLTLTGLLLLSKSIQRYCHVFTVKCVSFVGNSLGGTQFRDKLSDREMEGNLLTQYNTAISFITRNLKTVQVEKEFNTLGKLEIPLEVFVETITNALIHRDYYINAPVRLFIFDNRIELHSPGILPDSVTEENIKEGISVPRNKLLFDNAKFLLPYTGIGSGIMRVLQSYDKISFKNNLATEEFVITMMRDEIQEEENGGVSCGVNDKNGGVNGGVSGGVNEIQLKILNLIKENQHISVMEIAEKIDKPRRTIENNMKQLKIKGIIERFGSDKTGGYRLTKK